MNGRISFAPLFCAPLGWLGLAAVGPAGLAASADYDSALPAVSTAVPIGATSSPAAIKTYVVAKGDSLTRIASRFNTTRKKLEALNGLTSSTIKPGQVLIVGHTKTSKTRLASTVHALPAKTHHYLVAQPVQDFDVPAATFASCPVPAESEMTATYSPPSVPVAVTPPVETQAAPAATPAPEETAPDNEPNYFTATPSTQVPAPSPAAPTVYSAPPSSTPALAPTPAHHGLFSFFYTTPPPATDWGTRFTTAARDLAAHGIDYDDAWTPPGESHSWAMDCSNTSRYLYKVATGIQLPRTASDQYYYLHLQNKAWDVPQAPNGYADCNYLRSNLKARRPALLGKTPTAPNASRPSPTS